MPEKNKDRLEKRLLAMNNVQEIDELNILSGRIKKLQEDDTPLTVEIQ